MAERRAGLRPLKALLPKKAVPKTSAERSAAFRQRIKQEDPEKWRDFQLRQKFLSERWRLQRSDDKRLADREKARLRKQESRLRLKEKAKTEAQGATKPMATVSKPRTRAEENAEEKRRANARIKARDRQRKCRANMSTQKKTAKKAKRMAYYYHKKQEALDKKANLIAQDSKFMERAPSYLMRLKAAYKQLSNKRDVFSITKLAAIKNILNISKETSSRKHYQRAPKVYDKVAAFYEEQGVDLPGKRSVCRYSMKPKKVLTRKVADLFADFKIRNPNIKMSLTTFSRRRPRHVMLSSSRAFLQCLCEKCVNPMLKVDKLNAFLTVKIQNVDDLVERTVCGIRQYNRDCIDRKCDSCGVTRVVEDWRAEVGNNLSKAMTWFKWEQSEGKGKDKVEKSGTLGQMIDELSDEMKSLAQHLKTAQWQRRQYNDLRENLPPACAVVTIDFAENYLCTHQDEVQSAHWNYSQVSLHPCVLQYKIGPNLVTEYKIFLSDDLLHDAAFAKFAIQKCCTHLKQKGITKIFLFSDGCSSQYKSKLPFVHLTEIAKNNPTLTIERHFFGSNHGKSLCDSCGGVVKNSATNAVKLGREHIQNAEQMFRYCEKLIIDTESEDFEKKHILRSFELVRTDDLDRGVTSDTYKTLPGTRGLHAIRPDAAVHAQLSVKSLSCFCDGCLQHGNCIESTFTGMWTMAQVPVQTSKAETGKRKKMGKKSKDYVPSKKASKVTNNPPNAAQQVQLTQPAAAAKTPPTAATETMPAASTKTPPAAPTKTPPTAPTETQPEITSQQRIGLFYNLHRRLAESSNFLNLQKTALEIKATLDSYPCPVQKNLKAENFKKDKTSTLLYPDDGPPNLQPITIMGDGNCLPRCGSVIAFGNEQNHLEMRVRVVVELALEKERYLSPNLSPKVKDLPRRAGQYSEMYNDEVLTPFVLEQLFEKDVLNCIGANNYMGVWQLYALSSVLGIPLYSLYPKGMGHNVREDLMQIIPSGNGAALEPHYGIMWTHTQGRNAPAAHWGPNHFVVCLPISNPGTRLTGGDIVLVEVIHGNDTGKTVYPAQITRDDGAEAGAWGVYLRKSSTSRNSWVLPDAATKEYFIPLSDIRKVLEDYTLVQEGRSVVCTFEI